MKDAKIENIKNQKIYIKVIGFADDINKRFVAQTPTIAGKFAPSLRIGR